MFVMEGTGKIKGAWIFKGGNNYRHDGQHQRKERVNEGAATIAVACNDVTQSM